MEKYLENGQEIFDTFCARTADKCPIMFPRAPQQTYTDLYPDDDQPGTSFKEDRKRQLNYEAEVTVYRALEKLEEDLIALHSFEYTHHQYRLCYGPSHVRNGCPKCKNKNASQKEGECDFLIIGKGYFVIIEVKDMTNMEAVQLESNSEEQHSRLLKMTFKKSMDQRNRVEKLIHSIDKDMIVLHFTSYPNFSRKFQHQFQLSDEDLSSIIFREDLLGVDPEIPEPTVVTEDMIQKSINDFCNSPNRIVEYMKSEEFQKSHKMFINSLNDQEPELTDTDTDTETEEIADEHSNSFRNWWEDKISSTVLNEPRQEEFLDRCKKVRNMLLAIWCTDINRFDKDKCSLQRCITDIDEKLRSGKFTFRNNNPGVIKAPPAIRDYVGVSNLTQQQHIAFSSRERLLWINGPAGAGKSVILCGKIIELIQSDTDCEKKVVLFRSRGDFSSKLYCDAFDKAHVEYLEKDVVLAQDRAHSQRELISMLSEGTLSSYRVIIIQIIYAQSSDDPGCFARLIKQIGSLQKCRVFIDDFQAVLVHSLKIYEITIDQVTMIIDSILEASNVVTIWVTCDLVQLFYVYIMEHQPAGIGLVHLLQSKLLPNHLVTLSKNLRNTCDISNILKITRDSIISQFDFQTHERNVSTSYTSILPEQNAGHFLHGPKSVIHISKCDQTMVTKLLNNELDKLCHRNASNTFEIYVLYNIFIKEVEDIVKARCNNFDDEIRIVPLSKFCHFYSSAEWPVLIVVHETTVENIQDLARLYVKISRARVYCSVILVPNKRMGGDWYSLLRLLQKSTNAHIIKH